MISNRLKSLSKYFDSGDKVIDVGCDHALLDIYLIQNNIINNIIVSDIHEGAIKQGIDNIKLNKLDEKIDARLGDGLKVLSEKDDVDTILISGMGTSTILSILNNDYLNRIKKLVIQSNNDHELLRKEVIKLGFKIDKEELIEDNNKTYINIVFIRGEEKYNKDEIKYGPILLHNKEYLKYQINYVENIYKKIPLTEIGLRLKLKNEIKRLEKYEKNIK